VKELSAIVGLGRSFSIAIFLGINSLIASVFWCRTLESSPESHEANNQPAAHLADKHLGGLENRLVEESALPWIVIGTTVSNTLVVLILGQQGVANTCEQHHGYEKWDEASRRHVEEMADYRRPNFSGC
jgi:hypothetical protein